MLCERLQRMQRKPQRAFSARDLFHKGLVSRIHEELLKLKCGVGRGRRKNIQLKNGQNHFNEEDTGWYMKRFVKHR